MITLLGQPKSTQSLYKYTCRGSFGQLYMTNEGKALKEDYYYQVKNQWKKKPLIGGIALDVVLWFGTKRKCDIDNFNKLMFDSMTGIVFEDDSQIEELRIVKCYSKTNPRIEIKVFQNGKNKYS